ncbi:MAG: hypothetical protein HS100_07395 [Anaerolineales bacterium]|nr:hypothetical protein [Anaerolineales bacterium]MCK6582779.1 hypothetical protein [Anaerolineales bacterium]
MKQKFLIAISILAILALSACGGGDATPEFSAEDLASTAVAEAWLVVTQTAAAAPTSTPVPPTFTPQPINTIPATLALLPTLPPATIAVAVSPTPECNQIPQIEPKGTLTSVEFYNESGSSVNLAFGMLSPNDKGECYTYSFTISDNKTESAKVLTGCYWGWAWVGGNEGSIAKSGDKVLCLTDPAFIHKIVITEERVDFK